MMNVRFFTPMNATPLSELACTYTKQLVTARASVRLLPVRGLGHVNLAGSPWAALERLLMTPLDWPFVNLIAGEPFDWYRLWTANVKNVLVALEPPPNGDDHVTTAGRMVGMTEMRLGSGEDRWSVARVAARYDAILVPTVQISSAWARLGLAASVVPMECASGQELVRALT